MWGIFPPGQSTIKHSDDGGTYRSYHKHWYRRCRRPCTTPPGWLCPWNSAPPRSPTGRCEPATSPGPTATGSSARRCGTSCRCEHRRGHHAASSGGPRPQLELEEEAKRLWFRATDNPSSTGAGRGGRRRALDWRGQQQAKAATTSRTTATCIPLCPSNDLKKISVRIYSHCWLRFIPSNAAVLLPYWLPSATFDPWAVSWLHVARWLDKMAVT